MEYHQMTLAVKPASCIFSAIIYFTIHFREQTEAISAYFLSQRTTEPKEKAHKPESTSGRLVRIERIPAARRQATFLSFMYLIKVPDTTEVPGNMRHTHGWWMCLCILTVPRYYIHFFRGDLYGFGDFEYYTSFDIYLRDRFFCLPLLGHAT